ARVKSEAETGLTQGKSEAEEARQSAGARVEALERDNVELRKQLELAKTNLDAWNEKLSAAEKESLRLRAELDAARKEIAQLTQKYADVQSRLADKDDARQEVAADNRTVIAPAVERVREIEVVRQGNKKHGHKNGKNGRGGG